MVLLARKDEEGNTQALYDHLHGAGRLASGFEDEFADISRTAAVLHDVGKVAQQFQTYLLSDDGHRGDVQHARQGAFVVNDFFESKGEIEEIAKEILELAISKHHGGLPDCIDESGNRAFLLGFTESDKSNEKYAYQEIKRGLNGLALDLQSNFRGSAEDIACFLKKIKSLRLSKDSIYFYLGLLVKLIYSRLVDADRTDAACFETRKQYRPNAVDWQNLISRLDKSMRSFDSSSEINRIRHQINEQCCLAGARETGIYRLSIPTGGGKTLASLNFALHHALKTGKRRIIYVIPYLSITTQTAKTFRDVLGLNSDSDVLLEHYSTAGMQRSADVADNASSEFEDAGEHQRKLAAERWDNPIIVTTMVEFLETVMSARGTKLRKFHNMADSVIIFDEIQSLPMNTINLFNEIVSFLSKITNSTILLCSATQPLLEKTKRENLLLSEKPDLIAETESYEDKLRRTRIVASAENKSCDELGQIIYQQARKNGNCLAIVNLKKEAREIFQCLERLDVNHEFELIHLSTAMCGRHRTDCLNRIGALLDPGNPKPVICVSTQLIEAGVDISFACVVRAMAGLDSIMQAAGRCNRNGESVEPKNVYVYPLKDEDSMERYLPDIAMGKQLTLQIMENYPGKDLLSSNILEQYYDMLLRKKDGNLLTTYEMIQGASGQTPHSAEKDGDADAAKRALIPYGHTTLPVSLTVLVDANGCIRGVAKRKSTIIIPCTEESMGRTIKPVPHPLFDQLQYVDSGRSPEKTSMYLQQLAKWKGDDAKLEAVFKCVSEHSISEAAAHYGVELTDKDDKAGVCLRTACTEQCFRMLGESFRLSGVGTRFVEDCQY